MTDNELKEIFLKVKKDKKAFVWSRRIANEVIYYAKIKHNCNLTVEPLRTGRYMLKIID